MSFGNKSDAIISVTVGTEFGGRGREQTHVYQKSLLKKQSERGWGKPREKVSGDPQPEAGQRVGLSLGWNVGQGLLGWWESSPRRVPVNPAQFMTSQSPPTNPFRFHVKMGL